MADIHFDNRERFTELGFAIAYYRKRRGLSQDQLAERVGISRQHMGAVEAPNMNRGISHLPGAAVQHRHSAEH